MAGTYLAMRLGEKHGEDVCLFDKDQNIGGRLSDIETNSGSKKSRRLSVGGRRLLTSQKVMTDLAKELNIKLEKPKKAEQFCFARGKFRFVTKNHEKDKFSKAYPGLPVNKNEPDFEYQLIKKLLDSPERRKILEHPNLLSYMESVIGHTGIQFLLDMSRFKSDYIYPLSAKNFIDWLENEYTHSSEHVYPVGGMSQFLKKMENKAKKYGVRVYRPEHIHSINKEAQIGYRLRSNKNNAVANQVIIALPPLDVSKMRGNIIDSIRSQEPFKVIKGVRIMTITQWYKNAWWKNIKRISNGERVWRAWTSDNCLRSFEIPQEPYLANEKVFRVAYSDDLDCIKYFDFLSRTNHTKLKEDIQDGLTQLLAENGITTPVYVPKATKMVVKDWPGAWYWMEAGSPFSNEHISNWATKPLEGEDVSLVSDAYHLQRAGWSEAAILSAMDFLKTPYNFKDTTNRNDGDSNESSYSNEPVDESSKNINISFSNDIKSEEAYSHHVTENVKEIEDIEASDSSDWF